MEKIKKSKEFRIWEAIQSRQDGRAAMAFGYGYLSDVLERMSEKKCVETVEAIKKTYKEVEQ